MAWVVDSSVLIDVMAADPVFGLASATTLNRCLHEGLVICPLTYVELAPAFGGSRSLQDEFLSGVGVDIDESWTTEDTVKAHAAWNSHVMRRRNSQGTKRPLADILIGSFAQRFQGLITRNPGDFRAAFPDLHLNVPEIELRS